MTPTDKIAFLDRDGTLNFDPGYLNRPDELRLIPGVAQALKNLKLAGYDLVVVSNQSGISRGLIEPLVLEQIHARMNELLLLESGVEIDEFAICPHHPDEGCVCRKPHPTLLLEVAQRKSILMNRTVMIGDKYSDISAGIRAGCRYTIQVLTGAGTSERANQVASADEPSYIAEDLARAVSWLLKKPI